MPEREPVAPAPVLLQVVKGEPSAEELAALIAVVATRGGESAQMARLPVQHSAWAAPSRRLRVPLRPSTGAWRASALPRGPSA